MNNKAKVSLNIFHIWMWVIVLSPIIVGIFGVLITKGDNLIFVASTLLGAYLFKNGFRELPSKPLRTYGLITFFGRRTKYFVKEGYCMLPKVFLLDVIKIEIQTLDRDIPISVTTEDNYRITGRVSIALTPLPSGFGSFIDIGLYDGAFNQLGGIAELAGQDIVGKKKMIELEKNLSAVSELVAKIISGEDDTKNVHNDIQGLGIVLQKVQVKLNPPEEIANARLKKEVMKETLKGVDEQSDAIAALAEKLQALARKNGDNTTPFADFYKKAEDQIEVALKNVTKVVTDGKTKPVTVISP